MNNKMKSLMYVIMTLYMFNYVSTTCINMNPTQISDCTNQSTEEESEKYPSEFSDAECCCYYKSVISGKEEKKCIPLKKSNKSSFYTEEQEKLKNDAENNNESFDSLTIECENKSGSDSNGSGTDSKNNNTVSQNNNSIWLSLSFTFLFFGLLF